MKRVFFDLQFYVKKLNFHKLQEFSSKREFSSSDKCFVNCMIHEGRLSSLLLDSLKLLNYKEVERMRNLKITTNKKKGLDT